MKIDAEGKIIIPPTIVIPNSKFVSVGGSGTAISQGHQGFLNLWLPGRSQFPGPYALFRAVISKITLKLIAIHKTSISIQDAGNFQVSKNTQNDFLVALRLRGGQETYVGQNITPTGLGAGQWLFPPYQFQCFQCSFGISDDGRAAFFHEEVPGNPGNLDRPFFLQHLDLKGRAAGEKTLLKLQFPVIGLDITNLLKGGKRLLLYQSTGRTESGLFVIPLDGKTFRPIGKRIKIPLKGFSDSMQEQGLTGFTNLQSIDPRGRFIITSGISGGQITYIPLDEEGRPGPQKVLVHCCTPGSDGGIDLLKD